MNVVDDVLCENDLQYGSSVLFSSSNVCVGVTGEPVNACQGDSGGPFSCIREEDGRIAVYGLVSFGFGCRVSESHDAVTRVTKFLPWILKTIRSLMS